MVLGSVFPGDCVELVLERDGEGNLHVSTDAAPLETFFNYNIEPQCTVVFINIFFSILLVIFYLLLLLTKFLEILL